MVYGCYSLLWPKATIVVKSQRGYLWPTPATVHCGLRLQCLESHRAAIYVSRYHLVVCDFSNVVAEFSCAR